MGDARIRVTVEGAREGADDLDRVAGANKKVEDSAKGSGDQLMGLRDAFLAVGAASAIMKWKELIDEGDKLSDVMGQLGDASNEAARDVTQGLIPSIDLAVARGKLLAAQLQLTDQQFAAVAAAAQVFALRTGTDGAQALEQLTGALVSGNARGLRPFGIALQEGQKGAEGTAEALRQLSAAADANARNVAANTGAWDRLGTVYDTTREKLSSYITTLVTVTLDGLPAGQRAAEETARAFSGPGGLDEAFNRAAAASDSFARGLPLFGNAMADAAAQARGLARELLNIQPPDLSLSGARFDSGDPRWNRTGFDTTGAAPQRRTWDMLTGMPADPIAAREAARVARDRDLAQLTGQPGFGTGEWLRRGRGDDGSTRRRGGGGGGVETVPLEEALGELSDRAQRVIDNAARIVEDANRRLADIERDEDVGGFGAGGSDAGLRGGFGERAGAFNREGRGRAGERGGLGGERNLSQQTSAMARATEGTTKYTASLQALHDVGTSALGGLTGALEANAEAWIRGEMSLGKAIASALSAKMISIAAEAGVKALLATAEGLFMAATGNEPGAVAAFAAAAQYGLTAIAAGGVGLGIASAGGGGGRAAAGASAGTSRRASSSAGRVRDDEGGGVTIIMQLAPGAILGTDERGVENWLADRVVTGLSRQRRLRPGGLPSDMFGRS